MDFRTRYPDFATVESHIRYARAERSVAIANLLANGIIAVINGLKTAAAATGPALSAERDRRAIEADAFLKRSVPKY